MHPGRLEPEYKHYGGREPLRKTDPDLQDFSDRNRLTPDGLDRRPGVLWKLGQKASGSLPSIALPPPCKKNSRLRAAIPPLEANQLWMRLLLAGLNSIARLLHRKIRFHSEQIGDRPAFLIGELALEAVRVQDGLALRLRHLAQVPKCSGH